MKRIMLISPYFKGGLNGFPLGLAYIAGALREDYEVSILDLTAQCYIRKSGPNSILKKELKAVNPDIIGITSTSPTHLSAIETVEVARKTMGNDVKIIKGGAHETNCAETTLKYHPEIDFSVIGEGEETIKELLSGLESGESLENIRGIAYRQDSKIRVNPRRVLIKNLDILPGPARDLFYMNKKLDEYYSPSLFRGKKSTSVMTSRGCPYSCSFCSSKANWGGIRQRSVDNVIEEIKELYHQGFRGFIFEDDMSLADREWFLDFARKIKHAGQGIEYTFETRVDAIDDEIAKKLKNSGCIYIYFGMESGVQEILDRCGKGITLEQAKKAFELTRKYGIVSMASMQFGLPGEDMDNLSTVGETIRVLNEELVPAEVAICYTSLYPGSRLANIYGITPERYEKAMNHDITGELAGKIGHGTDSIHPPGLTPEKIELIERMLDEELKIRRFSFSEFYSV